MSGLLAIQAVTGSSPSYALQVQSSAGVLAGNHVVVPKNSDSTHGGIYRVSSVPDGVTINVEDDIKPLGGTYGAPTYGRGAYWTPAATGISTGKFNGTPFWGDVTERDLLVVNSGVVSKKAGKLIASSFGGTPKKATVTLATAYPNTDYSVSVSFETINNRTYGYAIESKAVNSFVVNLSTNNISDLVEALWETEVFSNG
jgi:hypothetical protein